MKKSLKTIAALVMTTCLAILTATIPTSADFSTDKSGNTIYTDESGERVTGWQTIGDKKYYFDKKGVLKTGWLNMKSGKKYFFKKDGSMATGWTEIDGEQYYFSAKGVMATGNKVIGNKIYEFDNSGVLLGNYENCGVIINGKMYSVDKNGYLDRNTLMKIDGVYYYIGKNGYSISTTKVLDGITYVFDADKGVIDSYVKLSVGAFKNDYLTLSNFEAKRKDKKVYLTGTLRNNSKNDLKIYIYASFYDSDGVLIDNRQIIGIYNLGSGETYKIDETKTVEGAVSLKFTDINLYRA